MQTYVILRRRGWATAPGTWRRPRLPSRCASSTRCLLTGSIGGVC